MEIKETSQFDQFDKKIIRRELLPIWIKIFCWLFMIMGVASIACLLYGALGNEADLSFYGLQTTQPTSLIGLFITVVMVFKGFTAYSLWFEKDNAITIGKIDAALGIVLCMVSMCIMPFVLDDSNFTFRLEIVLLIPFYITLNKIEYAWDNREEQ